MTASDGLAEALSRLVDELEKEARRRPDAPVDLLRRGLELPLRLDVGSGSFDARKAASEVRSALGQELDALVAHHRSFRPGHVLNLRTGSAEGKGTAPPDSRFVFGGYSPSGQPRFFDFAQWLLQLEHPDQHRLYHKPPGLVTAVTSGADLTAELLPVFQDAPADQKIHGQVTAGWYEIRRADGTGATLAVTLQAISSRTGSRTAYRRLGLNVLVSGPDGEGAEEVYARLDPVPWAAAVEWGRKALGSVESSQSRKAKAAKNGDGQAEENVEGRIAGILGGIARRLEQQQRGRKRRTGHAEKRHRSGKRPTRMAMKDLEKAPDRQIFVDPRKDTLIVLGERGRAHVFNRAGKLVTSIHYTPDAIERKRRAEIWRPAPPADVRQLRQGAALQEPAE